MFLHSPFYGFDTVPPLTENLEGFLIEARDKSHERLGIVDETFNVETR